MDLHTQRFLKAITYDYPDEVPVVVGYLPAAWMKYGKELEALSKEYPEFFPYIPDYKNKESLLSDKTYRLGEYTDEWGCIWDTVEVGMLGYVKGHPLTIREAIISLELPKNKDGHVPHGFMYLRLLDLRGFEEAMVDFAEECEELQILIDKVMEHNCIQVGIRLNTMNKGDIFIFGDDLGMQNGLAIGAEKWRKYLKPAFKKIYAPVKEKGCIVYMHTDGYVLDIIPDLVDCGVDVINPQFRSNGIDNLARICKGKIPLDLDLDRQLFPYATPSELDDHVRECIEALYMPEGGLRLKIELNYEVPFENMVALFEAARKYKNGV